jgi:SAM-dependent methyltransferase
LSDEHFIQYAKYYDALYADKDYASESRYINDVLRGYFGDRSLSILEFGSGTGKHAVELCDLGNEVLGVEPSPQMISLAKEHPKFKLVEGDLRCTGVHGEFVACIAMFHVLSYLSSSEDLELAFRNAGKNLASGGIFVFDVWHAPAVLKIGTEARSKHAKGQGFSILRKATSTHHPKKQHVNVHYSVEVLHDHGGKDFFEEDHLMRYWWPEELVDAASISGFKLKATMESFSNQVPSDTTWSVLYVFELS